jgi:tRNA A-37 threonylcarbamoyl transferase component Bud32
VLKRSPARSVRLEAAPDGASSVVVKRFAGPGLLAPARDRARARREHELLVRLHALGLPVPRPLALERRQGGWEVEMECVPRAHPFSALLEGLEAWPVPPGALARSLGRLLARLQACGIDHPDLHPGNALVDADGAAWAIDFHKARLVERLPASRLEAQLAHLSAGTRERCSARFRARFLWAWWRALPDGLRADLADLPALARRVEERARRERLPTVERRRLRWTRPGTAVRAVQLADGEGFERLDRAPGLAHALEAALERLGSGPARALLPCPGSRPGRALVLRGSWRTVSAAWYAAARLEEHALPAARPLAVARSGRAWAAFEVPAHGHEPRGWDELGTGSRLRGLGRIVGRLHDRGLRTTRQSPDQLWIDGDGQVQLACVSGLVEALDAPPAAALRPWIAALTAGPAERADLVEGFVTAFDGPRAQRVDLQAALRRS